MSKTLFDALAIALAGTNKALLRVALEEVSRLSTLSEGAQVPPEAEKRFAEIKNVADKALEGKLWVE